MADERNRYLGIYLNDHLAGSMVGIGRAGATRQADAGTEFEAPLKRLRDEFVEDREALEATMAALGISRDPVKPLLAGVGEKLGRLKPNGQLRGRSPLGRIVDLEVLYVGISGKSRMFHLLEQLVGDEVGEVDFAEFAARADRQRTEVERLQSLAATKL